MANIQLPMETRDQISRSTRRDYKITDEVMRQVKLAVSASKWLTAALLMAIVITIYQVWGGDAVFLFIITGIGPVLIGGVALDALSHFLKAKLAPTYLEYEAEAKRRIERARLAFEREVLQSADFWRSLTGHEFEHEFARLLTEHGFHAQVTRGSGDGGVDIVARSQEGSVAIQCKRYAKPVGPAVIRELYGAVNAGNFDLGILAVTGGVTRGVSEFIQGKPLRIIELPEIIEMQMALNKADGS